MSTQMMITKNKIALLSALAGFLLGGVLVGLLFNSGTQTPNSLTDTEKKPLYWVAPMDANYRRDKPGLSPMGMDLIPVYDEGSKVNDAGPGTISINPSVVNNLGVRTGLVERKPLHTEIVTVGYVQYDENKLIHIHPRVSGWIEKLYVKAAGDQVEKDAPLYALYSPELVNAQEELILAMNRQNTRLVQAAEDRLRALQIPAAFIAELKSSLRIKQTVTFFAPQSGVVDNLNIREGFFVQPGTTMFSIGALDKVWVEAEIFERQASLVNTNDPVTMTLDYLPGKVWHGQVDYIYPVLDAITRTVKIRLRFDNKDAQLKPNMFAQVTVHSDSVDAILVIPREALIRTGSQDRVVIALGEGSFKSVEVKVGRIDQHVVEIISGVEEGEKIVTSAQFLLDSESSKTSDFKRMNRAEGNFNGTDSSDKNNKKPNAVWVAGVVQSQHIEERMVAVEHDAIDEWGMAGMTMNFKVARGVDIQTLTPGTELHMQIFLDGAMFEISAVHIRAVGDGVMEMDTNMNHESMDHSQHMGVK